MSMGTESLGKQDLGKPKEEAAAPPSGRIMGAIAGKGGLAGKGGIAGQGGGIAG